MFNASFLDIVLSMIFLYLLVALVVTGINEFFFTFRRHKAKHLKRAFENFLYDDEWKEIAVKAKDSSFIKILQRNKNEFPSFIPAKNFAKAVLSAYLEGKADIHLIKEKLSNSPNKGEFSLLIENLLQSGIDNITQLEEEIGKSFDHAMERVSGWYKRHATLWSFFVALLLSLMFNIDSLWIARDMFRHKDKAAANADLAQQFAANPVNMEKIKIIKTEDNNTGPSEGEIFNQPVISDKDIRISVDSVIVDSHTNTITDTSQSDFEKPAKEVKEVIIEIKTMDIPIGWIKGNYPDIEKGQCFWSVLFAWLAKIMGILITAFAVSLGAPFWFDLLGKVSPLRKKDK